MMKVTVVIVKVNGLVNTVMNVSIVPSQQSGMVVSAYNATNILLGMLHAWMGSLVM
jgi:hypothetical protein